MKHIRLSLNDFETKPYSVYSVHQVMCQYVFIYIFIERERCIYQCSWWRLGFWNVTGSVTCVSRLGGPPTRIKIVYFKIKSKGLFDAFSALNF